jgi:hypothetical protein
MKYTQLGKIEMNNNLAIAALLSLDVQIIPLLIAKQLIVKNHYLHSLPGGTQLTFGVFLDRRLMGAIALGVGPANAHCLVGGARPDDCLTLTRLWLDDDLPLFSESKSLGMIAKALRKNTELKFLLSYADPSQGHVGTIYQAANWLYTGLSDAMPLYDIGDGIKRHPRSLAHAFGSRSVSYLADNGVEVKLFPQSAKHRYIYFLDKSWQPRLKPPILPYPKKEKPNGSS